MQFDSGLNRNENVEVVPNALPSLTLNREARYNANITGTLDDVLVYSMMVNGCPENTESHFRRLCERQGVVQDTGGPFG